MLKTERFMVRFSHIEIPKNPNRTEFRRGTVARVYDNATKDIVYADVAVCSEKDTFNKAKGRFFSLQKVAKQIPDKAVRKELYDAFFAVTPPSKVKTKH